MFNLLVYRHIMRQNIFCAYSCIKVGYICKSSVIQGVVVTSVTNKASTLSLFCKVTIVTHNTCL